MLQGLSAIIFTLFSGKKKFIRAVLSTFYHLLEQGQLVYKNKLSLIHYILHPLNFKSRL